MTFLVSAVTAGTLSFGLGVFIGPLLAALARRYGLLDRPDTERKFHKEPVPLVGGSLLWLAVAVSVGWLLWQAPFFDGALTAPQILAWLGAGLVLQVGGYLDDRFALRARFTIIAPVLATLLLVGSGVGFAKVTNPFGGVFEVAAWFGAVATFVWVLGLTYVMKLLDGADGLAGGVSVLGVATIAALALSRPYYQPDVALLSLAMIGALAAFLVFNVPPARYYLGEGGSTFLGFTLAFLSVAGGSKAATVALVAIIPTVDLLLVLVRRVIRGQPLFSADRTHLHHLLLDSGLSAFGVLAVYLGTSLLFGVIALVATSAMKLLALLALTFVTAVVIFALDDQVRRKRRARI